MLTIYDRGKYIMTTINTSPIHTELNNQSSKPMKYSDNQVNMYDLFDKKEIETIISSFNCLHQTSPSNKKCQFDVIYLPDSEVIIINNRNLTNDTVEINKKGQAISVGSWHRKELDGDFSNIIKSTKSKYEESKKDNENVLTGQLDSMATLGKSGVK